ncbi:hypothetical protein [Clostridium sp.]|uniref:hypothetical protein n=1 Tax=Clostridium sp. TaxID=1506 RepID=UPI0025B8893C|nr:hypothetical protein [Clostridium sp.]
MQKKIGRIIIYAIILTLTMSNIAYAQPPEQIAPIAPYGPKVEDLKNKEELVRSLREIETIRKNLSAININADSTPEDLKSINQDLEYYIQQFETIEKNLQNHKVSYKDSFSDVFFSEQILFVAGSFVISIRQQQNLIRELESNREEAKKLFYSSYLIPVYYYLTLGDNMIAYIETYFRIT